MSDDLFTGDPDGHATLEMLSGLTDGELTGAQADSARAHLARCADCSALARRLSALSDVLAHHAAEEGETPPEVPADRRAKALASATAAYEDARAQRSSRTKQGSGADEPRRMRSATVAAALVALVGTLISGMLVLSFDKGSSSSSPPTTGAQQGLVPGRAGGGNALEILRPAAAASRFSAQPCGNGGSLVPEAGSGLCMQLGGSLAVFMRADVNSYSLTRAPRGFDVAVLTLKHPLVRSGSAAAVISGKVVGEVNAIRGSRNLRITGLRPAGVVLLRNLLGAPG
ncbi:MAG: anti-sigma factor family protein [Acidimicrobiales bacterium]